MRNAIGQIEAAIHHRLQAQAGDNLSHLLVNAADIDHPRQTRPHADDLLLPAEAFDPAFYQGFAAREADRRLEEKALPASTRPSWMRRFNSSNRSGSNAKIAIRLLTSIITKP